MLIAQPPYVLFIVSVARWRISCMDIALQNSVSAASRPHECTWCSSWAAPLLERPVGPRKINLSTQPPGQHSKFSVAICCKKYYIICSLKYAKHSFGDPKSLSWPFGGRQEWHKITIRYLVHKNMNCLVNSDTQDDSFCLRAGKDWCFVAYKQQSNFLTAQLTIK